MMFFVFGTRHVDVPAVFLHQKVLPGCQEVEAKRKVEEEQRRKAEEAQKQVLKRRVKFIGSEDF